MRHKIVVNDCYGCFSLSEKAKNWLDQHGGWDGSRHSTNLVKCVETLGHEANGRNARLRVTEIDGNKYRIREHDGYETVETPESINWVKI